eukprot:gi/632971704/ref/XP_007902303.1/ PREDICTED: rho guanine nucleotide exchange factor 39 isoform X1 [Callorhinchus milii]
MDTSRNRTPTRRHLQAETAAASTNDQLSTPMARLNYSSGSIIIEEQRARWERKRIRAAKELVETEQRYSEQLELIVVYFIEILKAKGTLQQDTRDAIFCTMQSIHSQNRTLLYYLEKGKFGMGFEYFCPHLQLYSTYADNMENAVKVLQEQVKKNKSFARFKKLQESRPEFLGLKLEELLPLPLWRIQQYKHFLRDLTENTSPDNPEFVQLSKAAQAVSDISQYIKDLERSRENYLQMVRVQKLLKGQRTKVLTPGRKYIREGWLSMVPDKGEDLKPKMFFLFSDILLLAKPCHPLHLVHSDKFACQRIYPLIECTVDKVFGHTKGDGGLLSLTFPGQKFLVMSNDQEDINDWYRCMSTAIGQLKTRKTIILRKDNLARRPLRSVETAIPVKDCSTIPQSARKRNLNELRRREQDSLTDAQLYRHEDDSVASKRVRLMQSPTERYENEDECPSTEQSSGSKCTIL